MTNVVVNTGAEYMTVEHLESIELERAAEANVEEAAEQEVADRNRLIRKGKGVLDLCIEQNKLLCVQGFVDSQIERGGVYLEVVMEMQNYIAAELTKEERKSKKNNLRELNEYIAEKLREIG